MYSIAVDTSGATGQIDGPVSIRTSNDLEAYMASTFASMGGGALLPMPSAIFAFSTLSPGSTAFTQFMPSNYRCAGIFWGGALTISGSAGAGTTPASLVVRKLSIADSTGRVIYLVDGGAGVYAAQYICSLMTGIPGNSRNGAWNDAICAANSTYSFYFTHQSLLSGTGPFTLVFEFNSIAGFTGYTTAPTGVNGTINYVFFVTDAQGPGLYMEAHSLTNITTGILGKDVLAFFIATSQASISSVSSAISFAGLSYSTDQITVMAGFCYLGINVGANTNGTQATIPAGGPGPVAKAAIATNGQFYAAAPNPGPLSINFNTAVQCGLCMLRTSPVTGGYFGSAPANQ